MPRQTIGLSPGATGSNGKETPPDPTGGPGWLERYIHQNFRPGGYGLALVSVALATLLTGLATIVGWRSPFALFYPAVLLTAWYGGNRAGIIALLLSAVVGAYFFVPPAFSLALSTEGGLEVAAFGLVGGLLILLAGWRWQTIKRLEGQVNHLARAGQLLNTSLNQELLFDRVCSLTVPDLADSCMLAIVIPDGQIEALQDYHRDPAKGELLTRLRCDYPPALDAPCGYPHVIRTRQPEFITEVSDLYLANQARDEEHLALLRDLGLKSTACVPLLGREQVLGALSLATDGSGRYFSPSDLPLFEELAHHVALALEQARLYEAEQTARAQAEAEVAARRQTEEQLKQSLQEKEVLLREVHHRVRNNLQAISNLLYLQVQHTTDEQSRRELESAQNRVRSIALIHEKLYQTDNFARINFNDYVAPLVENLIRAYKLRPERIRLTVSSNRVALDVDTAVPVGVIVNELISNVLKHAFRDQAEGEIRVDLRVEPDGRHVLAVSDNGVGFPEGWNLADSDALGLQLVNLLARHMNGSLELERNGGTRLLVRFTPLETAEMVEPELEPG